MAEEDNISLDSHDSDSEELIDRRSILAPAILDVISALGGYEGDSYRLGDEAYGCLKDLKKFWRKDDTDDERTVARIFYEAKVLPNDIVPILLETAGKGRGEDKCAIACADLVTAMTWPIDMSEELKELDDELDKGTDYTQLLHSHLGYKAALLRPGVIKALLGVMLPCLAKDKKERKDRDVQIINVVLHLIRNLAFIQDPPSNINASLDQAEYSSLQSRLIMTLSETHTLDLLLTIASNATDAFFNQWNTVVLETFYLLFRGVKPAALAEDQAQRPRNVLSKLLEEENKTKRKIASKASSRHSRFGTTISVKLNAKSNIDAEQSTSVSTSQSQSFILHRQQALRNDSGSIFDLKKRKVAKKGKIVDPLGRDEGLSSDALSVLQNSAKTFIESCFNPFLGSLLKDIKSERPKITAKDHVRLLFVTKWFLDFFLSVRARWKEKKNNTDQTDVGSSSNASVASWDLDLVAEVLDRGWIVWILKRMREAVEEKPKLWTELQAGIECLTQLLLLIDTISTSSGATDDQLHEAAELLQQQLIYNGEVLDTAVESLRAYKEGVQSLTYLDSSVHLAYALLRMLEGWIRGKGEGGIVRRRAKPKRKRKSNDESVPEEEDLGDEEERRAEEAEQMIQETTFEVFEAKFAHEDITHTLMTYLSRWEEFKSPEPMKRVVNLLYRQSVKAKAEGLFFKVSTLNLFKSILTQQRILPRDQPYKDLISLINFILKRFFKAVQEDPLVIVEAFYPKNRGRWKQYSSWEPEAKESRGRRDLIEELSKYPPDVQVKKGYSWSEQLGIAVACLVEAGQQGLVDWIKEILMLVIGLRQRIVEETDGSSMQVVLADEEEGEANNDDDNVREAAAKLRGPSNDAMAQFKDYLIPYISDEQADAATKNPQVKLVFRLIKFSIVDDNADEVEWYVPAAILPGDLQRSLNVINQFLENPLDLGGKKASQMLSKKTKRRRRRRSPSADGEAQLSDSDEEGQKKRKARKAKEKIVYKSAQFIEDSDAEYYLDDNTFWKKEKALREKTELLAAEGKSFTMRATGTKKRKKRKADKGKDEGLDEGVAGKKSQKKRRKTAEKTVSRESDAEDSGSDIGRSDLFDIDSPKRGSTPATSLSEDGSNEDAAAVEKASRTRRNRAKAKPRPRPAYKGRTTSLEDSPDVGTTYMRESTQHGQDGDGDVQMTVDDVSSPKSTARVIPDDQHDSAIIQSGDEEGQERVVRKAKRVVVSDEEE